MKKIKLFIEHQYDFELLGLVSSVKDYKMAWLINQALGVKLIKTDEFEPEFIHQPQLKISRYLEEKDHGFVQLLKNRSLTERGNALYLIPELKMFDYFLLIQDQTFELDINTYIERLSEVRYIQSAVKLDISKIKSKENLLTY
jgi:hypothetical protein